MIRCGIQSFIKDVGDFGCFALCYVDIASEFLGRKLDVIQSIIDGISLGAIQYDWSRRDRNRVLYVAKPDDFLRYMTNCYWKVEYANSQDFGDNAYYINVWRKNDKMGRFITHAERKNFTTLSSSAKELGYKFDSYRVCVPKKDYTW